MDHLFEFLDPRKERILAHAEKALHDAHLAHYERGSRALTHDRLEALLDQVVEAARTHDLCRMLAHASRIADERYRAGWHLYEVQTAFNVFEEAIWLAILQEMPVEEQGKALSLLSTILGAGKDAIAREYVDLARKGVPQMDASALLSGG